MDFVELPGRKVPVYLKTDVVVVGGGVAGMSAAVSAVREGCKVLIIDDGGVLGGTVTKSLMPSFGSLDFTVINGFFAEFCEKLLARKALIKIERRSSPLDPEVFKEIAFEYIEKEGIELLLHSRVIDVVRIDDKLGGVFLANKSGIGAIIARNIIDTSGDGDVAALAGEAFDNSGEQQPMTLMFTLGGIDVERFTSFVQNYPDKNEFTNLGDQFETDILTAIRNNTYRSVWGFFGLIKKARETGGLYLPHDNMAVSFLPSEGVVAVNATNVSDLDPLSSKDITLAEIDSRKQMFSVHDFLKRDIPGFENSYITNSSSQIGVRESRRVIGQYVLTQDDVLNGRDFPDAVALNGGRISIHGSDGKQTWIKLKHPYQIPYRCLLAKINANLLIAGRCLSADHIAHASIRNVATCFATGQAAGIAAALSVKEGVLPRDLDTEILRVGLLSQKVILERAQ